MCAPPRAAACAKSSGIGVLGIAGIAALALATWSVQDPSFSHATNAPVRNALGLVGAASADLMMQILGIATVALLLPGRLLGLAAAHAPPARAAAHPGRSSGSRARSRPRVSPHALRRASPGRCRPGLGGVVGDSLLHVPAWVFGPLSGAPRFVIAIMLGIAAFAALALAAGFGLRREEDDEEIEEKPARKAAKRKAEERRG